jgi:hypothetical protein
MTVREDLASTTSTITRNTNRRKNRRMKIKPAAPLEPNHRPSVNPLEVALLNLYHQVHLLLHPTIFLLHLIHLPLRLPLFLVRWINTLMRITILVLI